MAIEIERKFLVTGDGWRGQGTTTRFRQGFLSTDKDRVVRVRIAGEKGTLAIKGRNRGAARPEFEYEIPLSDAQSLLDTLCMPPILEKNRTVIPQGEVFWEVDEFFGDNQGLIVAEVELPHEDHPVDLPDWVGQEVTHDRRYANSNLVNYPYSKWNQSE
ncbi:CYTH domain-containing protein [Magnetofaba australis]|uniref:Putative adenylate cyclase n=1 Tax=Magnetofaba australis IT-1 TaxID=1434232 RepID=A0A1Y2K2Z2_9PROT|nr:CYTH domain-containing protein [Magnetofaba australis]OSM02329.1 putative adenylate cyclase [Magnetofaba australis IT-1]